MHASTLSSIRYSTPHEIGSNISEIRAKLLFDRAEPWLVKRGVKTMHILVEPSRAGLVGLFAAASAERFQVSTTHYVIGLVILVVLMLVAMVQAYRMWEDIHDVEEPDSPADLLAAFEEAHAEGELDDEEFERVRRQLAAPPAEHNKPSAPADPDLGKPDGL